MTRWLLPVAVGLVLLASLAWALSAVAQSGQPPIESGLHVYPPMVQPRPVSMASCDVWVRIGYEVEPLTGQVRMKVLESKPGGRYDGQAKQELAAWIAARRNSGDEVSTGESVYLGENGCVSASLAEGQ